MKIKRQKTFANGIVYALETDDGYPIETTDTFLPYYTKNAIGKRDNVLQNSDVGSRKERWMIGVSVMSGCPVRCKFCATGNLKRWRNLTADEIIAQIDFILSQNPDFNPAEAKEFKINYTRMGEPFLNIEAVKEAIRRITERWPNTHHYVSTIGLTDSDFSWIQGNITLQLSLHSLDEERRNDLIPLGKKMTIAELGKVRTNSNLKTTVNLTLVDEKDFNITRLQEVFPKELFFIKLSPINPNSISVANKLGDGIIKASNLV